METKITRFVDLFLVLLLTSAAIYVFDEVLPPRVGLYIITNNHKQIGFTEELKINRDLDYTLLVEDTFQNQNNEHKALLVEVDEATYFRAEKGDIAYVYTTPINKHIRFCLDEKHPVLRSNNPFHYQYPLDISNLFMPILIIIMSLLAYKTKIFEVKFATFMFTIIFAIVLKWFLR